MTTVLQILPVLPPAPSGISDYAVILAAELRRIRGVESAFVACAGEPSSEGVRLGRLDAASLAAAIPERPDGVVVHFDFEVAPLLDALRTVRRSTLAGVPLVVMFHELVPRWHIPWQRRLKYRVADLVGARDPGPVAAPRRFAEEADHVVTNTIRFRQQLSDWLGGEEVEYLPSFSNIGEPSSRRPVPERTRRLVVFGSAGTRQRVYESFGARLPEVASAFGITELCDVGPPMPEAPPSIPGVTTRATGVLPATEIGALLGDSLLGLIDYSHHPGTLGKSGVLAAYATHGTVAVAPRSLHAEEDGVIVGRHYLTLDSLGPSDPPLQEIADGAAEWYAAHSRSVCAERFADLLNVSRSA